MKILYLVPREVFANKMARERFAYMNAFEAPHSVHFSGPGWPDWIGDATAADNARRIIDTKMRGKDSTRGDCDLVHAYMVPGLAGLRDDVPVCIAYNEANKTERVSAEVERNEPSYVIFHYANDLARYPHFERWGVQRVHIPHCADPTIYHPYGATDTTTLYPAKRIDVLLVGNMNADIYPFRVRLRKLALGTLRKRGYTVAALGHPGYDLSKQRVGTVTGIAYAQTLSSAKLVFTCSSRFRYALTKFSEIALCGSLAVSDVPEQSPEHFEASIFAQPTWRTDEEILRDVEALLDDEDGELLRRSVKARDLTAAAYTTEHYAAMFIKAYKGVTSR